MKKQKLSDFQKSIIFRMMILFFSVLIVEVVCGFSAFSVQNNSMQSSYASLLDYSTNEVVSRIKTLMDDGIGDKEYTEVPISVGRVVAPDQKSYSISADAQNSINNSRYTFLSYESMTKKQYKGDYKIYLVDCQNKTNLLFFDLTNTLKDVSITQHVFAFSTGAILASSMEYKDTIKETVLNTDWDDEQGVGALKGIKSYYNTNNQKTTYLVTAKKCTEDIYYVGMEDYDEIQAEIDKNSKTIIWILVSLGLLVFVGCFLYSMSLGREKVKINRKFKSQDNIYYLLSDDDGKIKRANDLFKKDFAVENIFSTIVARSKQSKIMAGDTFWSLLTDKENKEHYVNFLCIRTGGKYEFIGNLEDSFLSVYGTSENNTLLSDNQFLDINNFGKKYKDFRSNNQRLILGIFKINNYKIINEMFGEAFAEKYVISIEKRLKNKFGDIHIFNDKCLGILIGGEENVTDFQRDVKEILNDLTRSILIEYDTINVILKAGFVLVDQTTPDADYSYAVKCAYAALRRTMHELQSNYYIYHESQKKLYTRYFDYDFNVEKMLKNDYFEIQYQPQYNLNEKKVIGFEALFRMKKTSKIDITVYEFITYAEKTGKMMMLGNFIFREGMKFAKSIEGMGATISLNISPIQLMQAGFVNDFLSLYRSFNLPKGSICIEVTESFIMYDMDTIVKKLKVLRDNDIQIHLDDFGTSYSSLSYVRKLPIDCIKMDKSFIDDITKDKHSLSVVRFIVNLSKELQIESLAEGVESQQQADVLQELGCDCIQGFLIGRSLPQDTARELLTKQKEEKEINSKNNSKNNSEKNKTGENK